MICFTFGCKILMYLFTTVCGQGFIPKFIHLTEAVMHGFKTMSKSLEDNGVDEMLRVKTYAPNVPVISEVMRVFRKRKYGLECSRLTLLTINFMVMMAMWFTLLKMRKLCYAFLYRV